MGQPTRSRKFPPGPAATNGQATVTLDAEFRAVVDADNYMMFFTERGDMGGLFLTRQDANSFEVRSRFTAAMGEFCYRVVAKRRDDVGRRMERVDVQPVRSRDVRGPDLHAPTRNNESEPARGTR
jgi:hypothetical protein